MSVYTQLILEDTRLSTIQILPKSLWLIPKGIYLMIDIV